LQHHPHFVIDSILPTGYVSQIRIVLFSLLSLLSPFKKRGNQQSAPGEDEQSNHPFAFDIYSIKDVQHYEYYAYDRYYPLRNNGHIQRVTRDLETRHSAGRT